MSKNLLHDNAKNWYKEKFIEFENNLNGEKLLPIHQLRKDAVEKFDELDFPTLKNEEWKYTNIDSILKKKFTPSVNKVEFRFTEKDVSENKFSGFDHYLMVFDNGIFNESLSNIDELQNGVTAGSLKEIAKSNFNVVEKYFKSSRKYCTAFDVLNISYTSDGAVIIIGDGIVVDKPIQIIYLNGSENESLLTQPRNLIVVGKNSSVRIIQNFVGNTGSEYFSNVITEVYADENAVVDVCKIQNESESAFHIERVQTVQKRNSVFTHHNFSFGGKLVRNDINSELCGENIETNYNGLYLANNNQHVDNHTFVDHAEPNCQSNEVYKGILDKNSKGVFNGKILVRQKAQKTNAYQSNKTVLLSEHATIDTKPQLEIYADDVKCSHGATVGHLDDAAYFYIRSRGIPANVAKSMLIRAFANDVVDKVKISPLQDQLNHMIFNHLNRVEIG
ncbi:MAG: Fe-S cluster assembly protein SufD [Bacteroidetes bacterium]|nr:Fe-S cluster assembly protein SufD [Bacteroidota bacterium]MBU2505677.1 Fe-S cluster assembly protein SufD [Bacteroidota bacterium]